MSSRDLASSLMYVPKPKLCLLDRSHGSDLAKNARGCRIPTSSKESLQPGIAESGADSDSCLFYGKH